MPQQHKDDFGNHLHQFAIFVTAYLELKPQFVEAHNNLGMALISRGRIAEATTEFEKAPENQPRPRGGSQQPWHGFRAWRPNRRGRRPLPEGRGNPTGICRGEEEP